VICWMNDFLHWLTKINGAVTNNIDVTVLQCLILYFIVFVLVDWLSTKRYSSLLAFLSGYALMLVINLTYEIS